MGSVPAEGVQLGHHVAIIEFAQKHLDLELADTFDLFERMRRKRNDAFYDIALISDVEAEDAVRAVEEYLQVVGRDVLARFP
jgi:hypothetical protein